MAGWRNKTVYSSILNPKAQTTLIKRSSKTGESRWATLMSRDACVVPPGDGGEVVWALRVNESRPRGVGQMGMLADGPLRGRPNVPMSP